MPLQGHSICGDDRLDYRLRAKYAAIGAGNEPAAPPSESVLHGSCQDQVDYFSGEEIKLEGFLGMDIPNLPSLDEKVRREVVSIPGPDNNEIKLYISSPKERASPAPCVVYLHGGGMAMLSCKTANYVRWRDELAVRGLVAVGVEFRNSAGVLGPHRFPAGLNDCFTALQWVGDNRRALNITKVVLCGESGGGNLSIATALLAKQQNKLHYIDGVYAMCPCVSGACKPEVLAACPSMERNNGLLVTCEGMTVMANIYCDEVHNPLAWPYYATVEQLRDLPPHVITVNECDILHDEGVAYYRKLQAAEVPSRCVTILGTFHAADVLEPVAVPDLFSAAWDSVKSFAYSL